MFAFVIAAIAAAACSRTPPEAVPTPPPAAVATMPVGPDAPITGPVSVDAQPLLIDESGFPGGPAAAADGTIFIAGSSGELTALTALGSVRWRTSLPEHAAGAPLLLDEQLYVADRAGLSAFNLAGDLLWRFEHPAGTAISGPASGPDGILYYTIQSGFKGYIQAVTALGQPLWQTVVATPGYYKIPKATPNGQFVLFGSEVFSTIDGAAVDLKLDFEPEMLLVGLDRQDYLLFEDTLIRWTYADGRAVLAEERVYSPHELGPPILAGVLEDGVIWFVYPAAIAWFAPSGQMLRIARAEGGLFTHIILPAGNGIFILCGRDQGDLRNDPAPYCAAFSPDSAEALWSRTFGVEWIEFTGGAPVPAGAVVALEDGRLYRIDFMEAGK